MYQGSSETNRTESKIFPAFLLLTSEFGDLSTLSSVNITTNCI